MDAFKYEKSLNELINYIEIKATTENKNKNQSNNNFITNIRM